MKNQTKIEKSLNSLEGMAKAEPSPFLYGKILQRLQRPIDVEAYLPNSWLARLALGVVLVVLLNVVTLWVSTDTKKPKPINEQMELHKLSQEYFGGNEPASYFY